MVADVWDVCSNFVNFKIFWLSVSEAHVEIEIKCLHSSKSEYTCAYVRVRDLLCLSKEVMGPFGSKEASPLVAGSVWDVG